MDGCDCAEILRLIAAGQIDTTPPVLKTRFLPYIDVYKRQGSGRPVWLMPIVVTFSSSPWHAAWPVSYTHLDVYKRQMPIASAGGSCCVRCWDMEARMCMWILTSIVNVASIFLWPTRLLST